MCEMLRSLSKKLQNILNKMHCQLIEDIKVCFGDEKTKSFNIAVQRLYGVFSGI